MKYLLSLSLLIVCLQLDLRATEQALIPVIADENICCHPEEVTFSAGRAPRLKLKGIENLMILQPEVARLQGKLVTRAVLKLKPTAKPETMTLVRLGVSTIGCPWKESGREKEGPSAKGEICLASPERETAQFWAGPGSVFLDVVFGRGGTFWSQADVKIDQDWFAVELDPRLLEACAAGLSYGLALSDDKGQACRIHKDVAAQYAPNLGNNYVCSRESANPPVIVVEFADAPDLTPAELTLVAAPLPQRSTFSTGAMEVSWEAPAPNERDRLLGYTVAIGKVGSPASALPRWKQPSLPKPGERVRCFVEDIEAGVDYAVEVIAWGRGGKKCAAGKTTCRSSAAFAPLPECKQEARAAGPALEPALTCFVPELLRIDPVSRKIWDDPEKSVSTVGVTTQRLLAARGEWIGFQIAVVNEGKEALSAEMSSAGLVASDGRVVAPIGFSRLWYVAASQKSRWLSDPLVPLKPAEPIRVPAADNAVPGQTLQAVYGELQVPREAAAGKYSGEIRVKRSDGQTATLTLVVEVREATVPAAVNFAVSWNDYSQPAELYRPADDEAFWALQNKYHALSHAHRACMAIAPYNHRSEFRRGFALKTEGAGPEKRVANWEEFDRRWGGLFDGTAFKGTGRDGVPLDHFMLQFSENWPAPMSEYTWNGLKFEEHYRRAGAIEDGFSERYKAEWTAVLKDFKRHCDEKGWTRTDFHVFLNNKFFYKQYSPKRGWGNATSFWLFDEPAYVDDFLALDFFGRLFRSFAGERGRFVYRADVSRPQWQRDLLFPVTDLYVMSDVKGRMPELNDARARHGVKLWQYGGTPAIEESAYSIPAMLLQVYAAGFDGYVPAEFLGRAEAWAETQPFALVYEGASRGIDGPCASLRAKAYRRGQQDVELLGLLAAKLQLDRNDPERRRVRALLERLLPTKSAFVALDAQGGGTFVPQAVRHGNLDSFREMVFTLLASR